MDLGLAVAKHTDCKTRLLAAITTNETLDTATIAKDTCCDLGKWRHGDAQIMLGPGTAYSQASSAVQVALLQSENASRSIRIRSNDARCSNAA